jgi:hypothetical protein
MAKSIDKTYTVNAFSELSGYDRRTVKKILAELPGPEYSLRQFCIALRQTYGQGIAAERQRKAKLQADLLQRQLEEADRRLVPVEAVEKVWEEVFGTMKEIVLGSDLEDHRQKDILDRLATAKTAEDYLAAAGLISRKKTTSTPAEQSSDENETDDR